MSGDWQKLCLAENVVLENDVVVVALAGDRTHRVRVSELPDGYRLPSVVARPALVRRLVHLPLHVWQRNRGTELVGFKLDPKDRLIGEAWVPKAGLSAAEFGDYLNAVAMECDRFEFQLTGSDAT